jgi:glycosyltransferase involved in cell wall biosynthesis
VEDTIKSVLRQDYGDIEYIIVDGLSTDSTLEIVSRYRSNIARVISEKDSGIYDAINKGIKAASGDIIGILHSDDFYNYNSVISDYVKTFREKKCEAVYSDLYYVDAKDTDKIKRKWKSGEYVPGAFLKGWMPPHPTFFALRRMYDHYDLYNTSFKTAGDYELMLRFIHVHEIRVAYLPKYTIKMRTGGESNSSLRNRINANLEDRRAWQINNCRPRWYTLWLKPLRKVFQFL